MGGGGVDYEAPTTINYEEGMREALQAQVDLAPEMFAAESDARFGRKAYARLEQEILTETLLGKKVEYDDEGRIIEGYTGMETTPENDAVREAFRYLIEDFPNETKDLGNDGSLKVLTEKMEILQANGAVGEEQGQEIITNLFLYNKGSAQLVNQFRKLRTDWVEDSGGEPVYKKDGEGNPITDPSKAGTTEYLGGGLVSNIAGDTEKNFVNEDGKEELRKAGFDKDGNFQGISSLASDLQQLDTTSRFRGELKAIEDNAQAFTTAYRQQGNIEGALGEVTRLAQQSSIPTKIDASSNALTNIASGFQAPLLGQQSSQQTMGGQQQDPNAFTGAPQVAQGSGMAQSMGGQQNDPAGTVYQNGVAGRVDPNTGAFVAYAQDDRPMSGATAEDKEPPQAQDSDVPTMEAQNFTTSTRRRGTSPPTYITEIKDEEGNLIKTVSADSMDGSKAIAQSFIRQSEKESAQKFEDEKAQTRNTQREGAISQAASSQSDRMASTNYGLGDMGGLRSDMVNKAKSDLALGGDLSDRELRASQQQARMASTARGRDRDSSSVLAELRNNEMYSRQRENERKGFASQVFGMEGSLATQDASMNLQAQMANQSALQTQQSQLLDAAKLDIDRQIQVDQINRQFEMAGLGQDRGAAAQLVGLEQATAIDPTQALFGRPSGAGTIAGQNLYGNAATNNQLPQMYNPTQGLNFMAGQAAQVNNYNAAYAGAQAQVSAGKSAMMGNIIGGIAGGVGGMFQGRYGNACWVAREVYGSHNPRWLIFRYWMLNKSPDWFRSTYIKHGERFANWISNKPMLKKVIRVWMDSRIRKGV
jgi:hypothetical protein